MPARPRVVLIPGVLGSVLEDGSLTAAQAREICRDNLGRAERWLRGSPLYPCDKRPETLWGGVGSLHWIFGPAGWSRRMRAGDGYEAPGPVRAVGLFEAEVDVRGRHYEFKPYSSLVAALENAGADLLVFPYDWRLSAHHNARALQAQIRDRWFSARFLARGEPLAADRRITFIGHSMGGLIARYFLESPHRGCDLAARLVTIGTPHVGAPHAYLHFIGVTYPFPENPFYRDARVELTAQLAAAGASATGGVGSGTVSISAYVMPGAVQTEVFQFTASAIELMPIYDFVSERQRFESYRDTYRALVHTGTGHPALDVVDALRGNLVPEARLGAWLGDHGLDYHFVGARGFPTVSGYESDHTRILTTKEGDATVPLRSAHPVPPRTPHVDLLTLSGGTLDHARLCERDDVQAYCLGLLPRQPSSGPVRFDRSGPLIEDYVAMARTILANAPKERGIVLTVARLAPADGGSLIDTSLAPPAPGSRRMRLKNPLAHLSSPAELFEVESPRHGTFRYVWMLSNERASFPVGGVVFLPGAGEWDLHVVTFNVGSLDTSRCTNVHHAEMQLTRLIEEQSGPWRERIGELGLANRSREGPMLGYSPCNACCSDLAVFLRLLNAPPRPKAVDAEITWERLYRKGAACGHPTDAANVRRLRDAGWKVPTDPLPSAAPPAPAPAAPARVPAGVP